MTDKRAPVRDPAAEEGEVADWLWAAPPLLLLTAKCSYDISDGMWGMVLTVVFGTLSAIGFAAVIVVGVRRRAYETLITLAVGAGVFCALLHLKGHL
ncbi:hypothetical protein J4573_13820 [Actinomadura barringtoniae]|uniref:Uncharacterized protein n=1 Tax=Actinomadura barringtoniae TaxID=1427535 RepID=A0A939T6E8_9ACTN|nr:hypothetical protein [Actinomadura barringtoniae]MBO2448177.1 hypothetical protein [Actinomadura barringtoniae]